MDSATKTSKSDFPEVDANATLARAFMIMKVFGTHFCCVNHSGHWVGLLLDRDVKTAVKGRPKGAPLVKNYMRNSWEVLDCLVLTDGPQKSEFPSINQSDYLEILKALETLKSRGFLGAFEHNMGSGPLVDA